MACPVSAPGIYVQELQAMACPMTAHDKSSLQTANVDRQPAIDSNEIATNSTDRFEHFEQAIDLNVQCNHVNQNVSTTSVLIRQIPGDTDHNALQQFPQENMHQTALSQNTEAEVMDHFEQAIDQDFQNNHVNLNMSTASVLIR